jgi:hypothetical protein
MLVVYLFVRGIYVGHAFVCKGYRCWLCICVLGVSKLLMYFVLEVSMFVMYLCVRDIDDGHVFVC